MEIKAITLPESRDRDACYDFFFRVYRWWYNHNNDEALSEELFRERYGRRMGSHYHEKWNPMTGISGGWSGISGTTVRTAHCSWIWS